MQVVVETLSPLERKMKVIVPAERIDREVDARLKKLAKTAKIDGFRPGKIPASVLKQRFGKGVEYEALNEVLQESLREALEKEDLIPAGAPDVHLDNYESGKPLDFTVTFEVFPTIELKSFADLVIEKTSSQLTEEDLQKTLEGMRRQQILWEEVSREADLGDRVSISFIGKINGEEFPGGKGDNMPLVLGSHTTIPGFEEGLKSCKQGQKVVLNLTFPENYSAVELKGKPVQFSITVNKIEAPKLPEMDEAFAKHFGITEGGIEKLQEEVKVTLEQQLSIALRQKLKTEVMAKFAAAYQDLHVPKALIQREAEHLLKQMQKQFEQFKTQKMPELKGEMFNERARERVVLGLLINEIIKRDKLKPEPQKVRQLIEEAAQRFDHPGEVVAWYYQQKDRLAEMEMLALEDQVVEKIMAQATIVEKIASATELLNHGGM